MATVLTTITFNSFTLMTVLSNLITMRQRKLVFTIAFLMTGVILLTSANNSSDNAVPQDSSLSADFHVDVIDGKFNTWYTDTIAKNRATLYRFVEIYEDDSGKAEAVRLTVSTVSTPNASITYPVIFVVRREGNVLSWQVPLILKYKYSYSVVSRTICPTPNEFSKNKTISVEVTSMSPTPVEFTLDASIVGEHEFEIGVGNSTDVTITPATPIYLKFIFPVGVDSVKVHATSDDKLCAIISVQQTRCPVYDLMSNVQSAGIYQTWTTKASMTISRDKTLHGEFLIILSVQPSNEICDELEFRGDRTKNITFRIETTYSNAQLTKGIVIPVTFFLSFYLLFILLSFIYHLWEKRNSNMEPAQADDSATACVDSGQVELGREDCESIVSDDFFYDALDIDFTHDRNFIKRKVILFISNMARKDYQRVDKENNLYFWNLVTITIFYGLPVVQLVITYRQLMDLTGDEDVCYFNFECSHALGVFGAFNNVFSNIGYVLLGLLFIIVAYRRNLMYKRRITKLGAAANLYGIPQHFGLFYAMGWALVMEGIMSGSYHVCPNYSNFQFDTAFMYIISFLTLLKLYQSRHPDINAKAHAAYLIIACLILMAVFGVVYGTTVFWWIFSVIYLTMLLFLSLYLYYMVPIRLNRHVFKTLFSEIKPHCCTSMPLYWGRFMLLLIINAINWGIVLYGAIAQPKDFASFFLALFILNLMVYTVAYLIMKCKSGEIFLKCRSTLPILFTILLSGVLWVFALIFFLNELTSWQDSPAKSREKNAPCMLLDFYDRHDVWHFLSAIALFLSFMVILTMDDDVREIRRDAIHVF